MKCSYASFLGFLDLSLENIVQHANLEIGILAS